MAEATQNVKAKKPEMSSFEKFETPRLETPAAVRDLTERGISQAKENFEKMKTATEEATSYLETTYATASKPRSNRRKKACTGTMIGGACACA